MNTLHTALKNRYDLPAKITLQTCYLSFLTDYNKTDPASTEVVTKLRQTLTDNLAQALSWIQVFQPDALPPASPQQPQ